MKSKLRLIISEFGEYKVDDLNFKLVDQYLNSRSKEVSGKTANDEIGYLSTALNNALYWGDIQINPINGFKKLKVNERVLHYFTPSEFSKLYINSSKTFKLILLTAYHTGMRRNEIRLLKWEDVSLIDG